MAVDTSVPTSGTDCKYSIFGKWRLQHTSLQLGEGLSPDNSHTWYFGTNHKAKYEGFGKAEFTYSCEGDEVLFDAEVPNKIKIIRQVGSTLVWENLDFGGFFYLRRGY